MLVTTRMWLRTVEVRLCPLHIHNEIDLLAEVFVNCYDLGARENLKLFFNVTSNGQYVF